MNSRVFSLAVALGRSSSSQEVDMKNDGTLSGVQIISRLRSCSDEDEKNVLAHMLEKYVASKPDYVVSLGYSILRDVMLKHSEIRRIASGDFFIPRFSLYFNEDQKPRMSFGLAYLQDNYIHPDNTLDEKVAATVKSIVTDMGIDFFVDDIVVNEFSVE